MRIEYIYLLQEREFIKTNENIYKVGMTKKENYGRFNQYPNGSNLLFQMVCNDRIIIEKQILNFFKEGFQQRNDIGREYFEGDYKSMIDIIYSTIKADEKCQKDNTEDEKCQKDNTGDEKIIKNVCEKSNEIFSDYMSEILLRVNKKYIFPKSVFGKYKVYYISHNLNDNIYNYDDEYLDKHLNLRLLLKDSINCVFVDTITDNLFIETQKSKYTKIKICKELMILLEIDNLTLLNKSITNNFNNIIENEWLKENIYIIKKKFDIRTEKYNNFRYYNIYLLLITILKNLFDVNLFIRKEVQINKVKHIYHILDENVLLEHTTIMEKINYNFYLIDFES
jgi:hypothetical protein